MNRLALIEQQVGGGSKVGSLERIVHSAFDYLQLEDYISPQDNIIRMRVRDFVNKQIQKQVIPYVEQSQFPTFLIPLLRNSGVTDLLWNGDNQKISLKGLILAEMARGDGGLAVSISHSLVLYNTIQSYGSNTQKQKYLPQLKSFQLSGQVQPNLLSGNTLNLVQAEGKTTIKGEWKWIANKDLLCVIAQNDNLNLQAFLIQTKKSKDIQISAARHSNFLRCLPHHRITFNQVSVVDNQKISLGQNYPDRLSKISRQKMLNLMWIAAGICMGVYESVIHYTTQRKQFGRSISAFQMVQEKIVKTMANTQAILLICFRCSKLYENNDADLTLLSSSKSYVMERARECGRWGRQVCGGNGILHQNYSMRALADIEALAVMEGKTGEGYMLAGLELLIDQKI